MDRTNHHEDTGMRGWTFLFLVILCLTGCFESGSEFDTSGSVEGVQGQAPAGGAHGFLLRDPSGRLVVSHQAGSGGGGVVISLFDLQGQSLGQSTTAADGSFRLGDLPAGAILLEFDQQQFWFTSILDADIPLGKTFTVTRAQAAAAVLAQATVTDLVIGSLQPLPGGALIRSSDADPDSAPLTTLPSASWLFYLDPTPTLRFSHPVVYLLVDAESGALTRLDATSAPTVNGGRLWVGDLDIVRYLNLDLEDRVKTEFETGPEALQLPEQPKLANRVAASPVGLLERGTGTDDVYAIILQAESENSSYAADRNHVFKFLTFQEGVPADHIWTIETIQENRPKEIRPDGTEGFASGQRPFKPESSKYHQAIQELRQIVEARLTQGRHTTLIVYITAHDATAGFTAQYKGGFHVNWSPAALNLEAVRACKIRVLCDFCYSANFIKGLGTYYQTQGVPLEEQPDLQAFSACGGREQTLGIPAWLASRVDVNAETVAPDRYIPPIILAAGGMWTNTILPLLHIENADLRGLLTEDGKPIVSSIFLGGAPAGSEYIGTIHPEVLVRPNVPSYCPTQITFVGPYDLSGNGSLAGVQFRSDGRLALTFPSLSPDTGVIGTATITGLQVLDQRGNPAGEAEARGEFHATLTGDAIEGVATFTIARTGRVFEHHFSGQFSADRKGLTGAFDEPGDVSSFFDLEKDSESPPRIDGYTPTEANTGAAVTITGENLGDIQSRVFFNGIEAGIPRKTPAGLVALVPAGDVNGLITLAAAGSTTTRSQFRLAGNTATPMITSVTPTEVNRGDTLTIRGTGLGGSQASVSVGNAFAPILSGDDRELKVSVGLSAYGRTPVLVERGPNQARSTELVHVRPLALSRWSLVFDPGSTDPVSNPIYFTQMPIFAFGGRFTTVTGSGGSVIFGADTGGLGTLPQEVANQATFTNGLEIRDTLQNGVTTLILGTPALGLCPLNTQDGSFDCALTNANLVSSAVHPGFRQLQSVFGNFRRDGHGVATLEEEWWLVSGPPLILHNQ